MSLEKEKKDFYKLLNSISYDISQFDVLYFPGKEVIGYIPSINNNNDEYDQLFKYKTFFNTILDIDCKIKYSFERSIDLTYNSDILKNFNPFATHKDEFEIYYFIENAVFRISTLWDILAQLYNIKYKFNDNLKQINYNKIFKNWDLEDIEKYQIIYEFKKGKYKSIIMDKYDIEELIKIKIYEFKKGKYKSIIMDKYDIEELIKIKEYLNEEEPKSIQVSDLWKGNHKYLNDYRNKMIHRNSPNITNLTSIDTLIKAPPNYILKRLTDDFYTVSTFINNFISNIDNK